jgi:hypothetical protein
MKRKTILFTALATFIGFCSDAQPEPSVAPKINPFSLNPDNLGSLSNSVNLFTGDLNLPLNLVSIPGDRGLGIDVTISYNSTNIENIVDTWNLDSPTGILGLGWSMALPMIMVDNKQTGARDDDEFYLIDGGGAMKLVCVGSSSGIKYYKTKNYTNWNISFAGASDKWEIIKEDGMRYIYGDNSSGRNTVQWLVKWGNWIGSSNQYGGQQQGFIWNLSEVKNLWGEKITYTYSHAQNNVGNGSAYYTEASYLTKINDAWGREVELTYQNKLAEEYQDPHTEQFEPDAYQERYERKYLDKIFVRADGNNFYTVDLKYLTNSLGTGNLTKRLLKSVTKIAPSGNAESPMRFDYLLSGPMKGAMNKVTNATGGTIVYDYHAGLDISLSNRELTINAPAGYAEPSVFNSGEYAFVTWREYNGSSHDSNPKNLKVFAYSWEGRWVGVSLDPTVSNVKLLPSKEQDFIGASAKDFFALLVPTSGTNYNLHIWHRDEKVSGGWIYGTFPLNLGAHDSAREKLLVGNNFIAVSNNNGTIFRFVWNGSSWIQSTVTESINLHFTSSAENFILSHNTGPTLDVLTLYYLDEQRNWQSKTLSTPFNAGSSDSYWYCSNTMAVGMIFGANEFLLRWDENYNLSLHNTGFGYPDNSFVKTYNESIVSITQPNLACCSNMRALRYNGVNWVDGGDKPLTGFQWSNTGDDLIVWEANPFTPLSKMQEFNPNLNSWNSEITYSNNMYGSKRIGINSYSVANRLYFRKPSGVWDPFVLTGTAFAIVSPNLYFTNCCYQFIRNGAVANSYPFPNVAFSVANYDTGDAGIAYKYYDLFNGNTIVSCPYTFRTSFQNANTLTLNRVVNYSVLGGLQRDYPITKATTFDGSKSRIVSFDYSAAKGSFEPSGTMVKYNLVTTIPGGTSILTDKPYGYTETYFFNNLSSADLSDNFPVNKLADPTKNADSNHLNLSGQIYRTRHYNSAGTMVAENSTFFEGISTTYTYTTRAFELRNKMLVDGIEERKQFYYNSRNQLSRELNYRIVGGTDVITEKEITYCWETYPQCLASNIISIPNQVKKKRGSLYTDISVSRWKDWPCIGANCLTPTVPAQVDQYTRKRTNSDAFIWWDVATQTPSTDWVYAGNITVRDNATGNELERKEIGNQLTSQILDGKQRSIASAINAGYNEIAYTGFEDASKGNWTWTDGTITSGTSRTGDKSINIGTSGITKTGLLAPETYIISFWMKKAVANSGSVIIDGLGNVGWDDISTTWNYYEYKVTGITSLTIKNSGSATVYIDDLRFYPSRARMVTQTYHPFFGISSQTAANNQTIYTDYDEFGRVKGIMDNEKNIIGNTVYNSKKQ